MATLDTYGYTDSDSAQVGTSHSASGLPAICGITGVLIEHEGTTFRQWIVPGFGYEIRSEGGWKLYDVEGVFIGNLLSDSKHAVSQLPTANGPMALVPPNSYLIRETEGGTWEVHVREAVTEAAAQR